MDEFKEGLMAVCVVGFFAFIILVAFSFGEDSKAGKAKDIMWLIKVGQSLEIESVLKNRALVRPEGEKELYFVSFPTDCRLEVGKIYKKISVDTGSGPTIKLIEEKQMCKEVK